MRRGVRYFRLDAIDATRPQGDALAGIIRQDLAEVAVERARAGFVRDARSSSTTPGARAAREGKFASPVEARGSTATVARLQGRPDMMVLATSPRNNKRGLVRGDDRLWPAQQSPAMVLARHAFRRAPAFGL